MLFPDSEKTIKFTGNEEKIKIVEDQLKFFFDEKIYLYNHEFMGFPIIQHPADILTFQEMIFKLRPDNIIETGFGFGGSAVLFAAMMELLDLPGKVYSTELNWAIYESEFTKAVQKIPLKILNRLKIIANTTGICHVVLDNIRADCLGKNNLVILDSDHSYENVLAEMLCYAELVLPGGYMIVEDTILDPKRLKSKYPDWWIGPKKAIELFLKIQEPGSWEVDISCEKNIFTFHKGGFLKRLK